MGFKRLKLDDIYNKNLKNIIASNCMVALMTNAVQVVLLCLYIKSRGFDEMFLGNMIALRTFACGATALFAGPIANKLGRRNTMMFGIIVAALGYVGQCLTNSGAMILFFGVLNGVGLTLDTVNEAPSVAQFADNKHTVTVFSTNYILSVASTVVGTLLAGVIPGFFAENALRNTILVFSCVSLVNLIPLSKIPNKKFAGASNISLKGYANLFKNKKVIGVLTYNVLIGFGAGLVVPFFTIFLQHKLAIGTSAVGNIMSFAQIATVIGAAIVPLVSKKIGRVNTVNICQLLSIPFLLSISFSSTIMITTIGFFCRSALMNMTTPITTGLPMELVEDVDRSSLSGLNSVAGNISRAISAVVAGWLMYHISYEFPYYITSVLYLLASIVFAKTFKDVDKEKV